MARVLTETEGSFIINNEPVVLGPKNVVSHPDTHPAERFTTRDLMMVELEKRHPEKWQRLKEDIDRIEKPKGKPVRPEKPVNEAVHGKRS